MSDSERANGLFPALLKHWRRQRGLSQLDLALAADVSSRHISFIETGRSRPSVEMVLLLATTLGVPLHQINEMLRAAGHDACYPEPTDALPEAVAQVLSLLGRYHEPFPVIVIDRAYRVLDLNRGAAALLGAMAGAAPGTDVDAVRAAAIGTNLAVLTFDPAGAQPHIVNFDEVGCQLLWRIQREVLAAPDDGALSDLLDQLLALPTVDPQWRRVDLTVASDPALVVHVRAGDQDLRFLTMVSAFQAPQNVAVDDLRIETWFPADETTAQACGALSPRLPGR